MQNSLTIAECRQILGDSASEYSDEHIQTLRDELEKIALTLYEKVVEDSQTPEDIEALRWAAYYISMSPEEAEE